MATAKMQAGILFIDKDKMDIFHPGKNTVMPIPFQPQIIRDMEIVDREMLYTQIKSFTDTNQLQPCSLYIILSKKIIFEKDFVQSQNTMDDQEKEVQNFLENVPFESVGSKVIPLQKGFKVVSANADLYETIKGVFEQIGFLTQTVLPSSIFGIPTDNLDQNTARFFLQKADGFKRYSLTTEEEVFVPKAEEEKVKKKNYTMIIASTIMLSVAALLIIYAIFFLK